jgi:hypothetical protein
MLRISFTVPPQTKFFQRAITHRLVANNAARQNVSYVVPFVVIDFIHTLIRDWYIPCNFTFPSRLIRRFATAIKTVLSCQEPANRICYPRHSLTPHRKQLSSNDIWLLHRQCTTALTSYLSAKINSTTSGDIVLPIHVPTDATFQFGKNSTLCGSRSQDGMSPKHIAHLRGNSFVHRHHFSPSKTVRGRVLGATPNLTLGSYPRGNFNYITSERITQ